jgi:hypothetical protein
MMEESPGFMCGVIGSSGYFRQLHKRPSAGFPFPHFYGFADGDPPLQLSLLARIVKRGTRLLSPVMIR